MKLTTAGMIVALVLMPLARVGAQESERGGLHDNCIRTFYDASFYNWYAFENRCDYAIHVVFCGRINGGCGAMDLRVGRKDNTGRTKEEVDGYGGYSVYVCRDGYVPVNVNDRYVERAGQQYRCKKQ